MHNKTIYETHQLDQWVGTYFHKLGFLLRLLLWLLLRRRGRVLQEVSVLRLPRRLLGQHLLGGQLRGGDDEIRNRRLERLLAAESSKQETARPLGHPGPTKRRRAPAADLPAGWARTEVGDPSVDIHEPA